MAKARLERLVKNGSHHTKADIFPDRFIDELDAIFRDEFGLQSAKG
jgi:hypothetical protein